MKVENVMWSTMNTDTRTDKVPENDIFCMGCRAKLGRVIDHKIIHLTGWDRMALFDCEKETVTVKCRCGVGRVIRRRGNHDEGFKENLNVWMEEASDSSSGEHEDRSQRESKSD